MGTFEEDSAEDYDLEEALTDDVFPHLRGDQVLEFGVGLAGQKLFSWRFGCEGQWGHGVHNEVDPQHLDGAQRWLLQHCSTCKGHDKGTAIDSQLELQKLPDRIEDISSPLHSGHNWAEIIVKEDDTWGLFGNLGACNTHSKSNISFFKGRGIVGTITCHGYNMVKLSETSGHDVFIGWWWSCQNFKLISNFLEVLEVSNHIFITFTLVESSYKLSEISTSHNSVVFFSFFDPVGFKNSCLFGDGDSSGRVVSSDHSDSDSSWVAFLDGSWDGLSDGIFDTDHTQNNQIFFNFYFLWMLIQLVVFLISDQKSSKGIISKFFQFILKGILVSISNSRRISTCIKIMWTILEYEIRSSFAVDNNFAFFLDDSAHGFGFRWEGNNFDGTWWESFSHISVIVTAFMG